MPAYMFLLDGPRTLWWGCPGWEIKNLVSTASVPGKSTAKLL